MVAKSKDKSKKEEKNVLKPISEQLREKDVESKAYELYENRGYEHGKDADDWFEAERIVNL